MKIKQIFGDKRIIGLAGAKNSGKTNNLISLIVDFRKQNNITPIYVYGFSKEVMNGLKDFGVVEISNLDQLATKKNAFLILDEFQRLNLNDRRYVEQLNSFVDFVYHNNVNVVLCSPNIREFNSIIGSKIEQWIVKTVKLSDCVRGSQLKTALMNYKGRYKIINSIVVPINELLILNDEREQVIECDYINFADSKKANLDIFQKRIITKQQKQKMAVNSRRK